jgi:hypothetical protein
MSSCFCLDVIVKEIYGINRDSALSKRLFHPSTMDASLVLKVPTYENFKISDILHSKKRKNKKIPESKSGRGSSTDIAIPIGKGKSCIFKEDLHRFQSILQSNPMYIALVTHTEGDG